MSGISQYYHGEQGEVVDLTWVTYEESLLYEMSLRGDPHRHSAFDYGSDIGIDPQIKPRDRVVYLRLNQYGGIWVEVSKQFHPELDEAERRVIKNRDFIEKYRDLAESDRDAAYRWAESVAKRTAIRVRPQLSHEKSSEKPGTPATVFLSYSSRNVLMAREMFRALQQEAQTDVWFDLRYAGESPTHDETISAWLERAVHECQIFLVLLTQASVNSDWVRREIDWAADKANKEESFHLILLKLEEVPVPKPPAGTYHVVDCSGLSTGEIREELYAAVYKRQGRRKWLEEQKRRGWPGYSEGISGYDHLRSESGIATALRWIREDGKLRWVLEYNVEGVAQKTEGGEREGPIVDLGIRPGDRIGFFMFNREKPLWMRSDNLGISPNAVIGAYDHKFRYTPLVQIANLCLVLLGLLIIAAGALSLLEGLSRFVLTVPMPGGVAPHHELILKTSFKVLFSASVLIWGLYQLVGFAYPQVFSQRRGQAIESYMGQAFKLILYGTLWYPVFSLGLATLLYVIPAIIVLAILEFTTDWHWSQAFWYGFVVTYGLVVVLHALRRLWKLIAGAPESLWFWRSFSWRP
jgi:TIR domain